MSPTRLDDDDTIPTDGQAALADLAAGLELVVADWGVASATGRVRDVNEDAWGQDGRRFVVADGMGGHAGGALASRTAVRAFLAGDAEAPWAEQVAVVNDRVRAAADQAGTPGAGTTMVAVRVRGRGATIASVGDSRVYRWRGGTVDAVTADHTLASDLLAVGVNADRQRRRGVRVSGLTSFLGVEPARLRADVTEVELRHDDRLALVSDGIHGQLDRATVAGLVGRDSPQAAADALVAAAESAGGRDNATALVVELALDATEDGS